MRILTTTLCYPTPARPEQGIFVHRRAAAVAERPEITLRVVSPMPWFPGLRRSERVAERQTPLHAAYPPMVSPPVLNWATDGVAFGRVVTRAVDSVRRWGGDVDLIDAHFVYPDGVGAWLAGRRLGIPVSVTTRGKFVRFSLRGLRRLQIRAMLRTVDARIAVSASLAEWVRRVAGSDLAVDVIPNGVEARTFRLIDRAAARASLGWDPDARYLLSVGHLNRQKGFDRLLEVLPSIRQAVGDVRLVLAGTERGERAFQRQVRRMLAEHVNRAAITFAGPADSETLNRMYNAADVFISASRNEGWCNAIAESLAAGTPVVATDVGGNAEQICSSELGTIVPDGDLDAIARAAAEALSREWNRVLISAHGGARGWAAVAAEVVGVFERVVARRREGVETRKRGGVDVLNRDYRHAAPAGVGS